MAHYQPAPVFRPAYAGTRSEVYPRWSEYLRSYQGPGCSLPGDGTHRAGRPAWTVSENSQRRVAVVVVGVTPHQGDGSTVRRAKGHKQRRSNAGVYGGDRPHRRRSPRLNISFWSLHVAGELGAAMSVRRITK